VSKKVKEVFNNGEEYLRLNGKELRLPERKADWPDVDLLRWHNNNRYLRHKDHAIDFDGPCDETKKVLQASTEDCHREDDR
jgi:hypothetical protein